jgi:hypothetical protein
VNALAEYRAVKLFLSISLMASGKRRVRSRNRFPLHATSRRSHNTRCNICCPVLPDNRRLDARMFFPELLP